MKARGGETIRGECQNVRVFRVGRVKFGTAPMPTASPTPEQPMVRRYCEVPLRSRQFTFRPHQLGVSNNMRTTIRLKEQE